MSEPNPYSSAYSAPEERREVQEDPLVTTARREAWMVGGVWVVTMVYSCWYCYANGYHRNAADIEYVFGFPDWVFWGIVVPWCGCTILAWGFSYIFIRDTALGEEVEMSDGGETPHA